MNVLEAVKTRYAVRKYSNRKIEEEKMQQIFQAIIHAPTACNYQPQKIYVLESDDAMKKLKSISKYDFGASIVLMFCYDNELACKRPYEQDRNYGEVDATLVSDEVMLVAWELGLGTCWVAGFDPKKAAEVFDIPENITPFGIMPIGYPADDSKPYEKFHSVTRSVDEMVIRL